MTPGKAPEQPLAHAPRLIACWHFDETDGVYALDASPSGLDAELVGAQRTSGVAGNAVRFSRRGDAIVADGLGTIDQGAVEAWVCLHDHPSSMAPIIHFGGELRSKESIAMVGFCPGLNGSKGLAMGFLRPTWVGAHSDIVPPIGEWCHIAATWGPGGARLFLNGELLAHDPQYTRNLRTHPRILIGASASGDFLPASVDEVRIYVGHVADSMFAAHAKDLAYASNPPARRTLRGFGPSAAVDAEKFYDPASFTSGLQEAIDSLGPRGGAVNIPPGKFLLRRSVILPSNIVLRGSGLLTVIQKAPGYLSALNADALENSNTVEVNDAGGFQVGQEIGVRSTTQRGYNTSHAIIMAIDGDRLTLDRPVCKTYKQDEGGLVYSFFPAFVAEAQRQITLENLQIFGDPGRQPADAPPDFSFAAIHIHHCARVNIRNVQITGWPSDGIGIQGDSEIHVTGCTVERCWSHGIHPGTNIYSSVITGNIARENAWDGIYFCYGVKYCTVSNNTLYRNGRNGIGGLGDAYDEWNVVSGNTCVENGEAGIRMHNGANNSVVGNVCVNNSRVEAGKFPGIQMFDTTGSLVANNRVSDNQQQPTQLVGISESGASDHNLIVGNHLHGCQKAIEASGLHTKLDGNLI